MHIRNRKYVFFTFKMITNDFIIWDIVKMKVPLKYYNTENDSFTKNITVIYDIGILEDIIS